MRYIVSVVAGSFIILLFYGFSVASGGGLAEAQGGKIVYVDSGKESEQLRHEVNRLRTLSRIRDVLEAYYPSVSIGEKRELSEAIYEACSLYDLKVELVLAVIKTESAFRETAVSDKGAMGLMQVLPRTGLAMAREIDLSLPSYNHLLDRRTTIMLGCYYLKKMLDRYGSLDHALLAYNTGPTRLDRILSTEKTPAGTYAKMVTRNLQLLTRNYFSDESDGEAQ